ncbi:hypothetical protein N5923_09145 [Erwiniaceae bacterium BAC15a-03b]|uniref:Uncharacterized protein n=1 Tax=Winslowiella arboricola TaxID=2978220 RepID=A0A9J6PH70_9GAMM|nr:hypothetical protein [Winslowiella arboricola]MCU5773747.1 hypothetical protein [Winslowiella arboricola]MCU5777657.1 hypothetical protein [Winslowiella arboricola]
MDYYIVGSQVNNVSVFEGQERSVTRPAEESNIELMMKEMISSWRREIMLSAGGWSEESKIEW